MKSLRHVELSELDFVRLLAKEQELLLRAIPADRQDLVQELQPGRVRAVWEEGALPTGFPTLIVAQRDTLKSMFGRLLALPGGISPLTSIVRAWDVDDLRLMSLSSPSQMPPLVASGFVGLIVGELIRAIGKDADLRRIGLDVVRRTLAFTCAQAAARGYPDIALATVVTRWLEVSQLTGNQRDPSTAIATANLSAFVVSAFEGLRSDVSTHDLARVVQSWTSADGAQLQADLIPRDAMLEEVALSVRNRSREVRVDVIEAALAKIRRCGGDRSLEKGFLISLIDPGSFDFLDYAGRYDDGDGSVILAYTMCAGILGGAATFGKFRGFGMNVYANGLRPDLVFEGDVSLAEIRILNDPLRETSIEFRTRSPSAVDVELVPRVYGSFSTGARRKQMRPSEQLVLSEADALRERMELARRALDAAYAALDELTETERKQSTARRRQKRSPK